MSQKRKNNQNRQSHRLEWIILILIGSITKSKEKYSAAIQIILGLILVILSLGGLSVILNILDAIIALAIIIVIFGISIVILGLIKPR